MSCVVRVRVRERERIPLRLGVALGSEVYNTDFGGLQRTMRRGDDLQSATQSTTHFRLGSVWFGPGTSGLRLSGEG
jgi:hypothetical protein